MKRISICVVLILCVGLTILLSSTLSSIELASGSVHTSRPTTSARLYKDGAENPEPPGVERLDFPSQNDIADIGKGYDSLNATPKGKCVEYREDASELNETKPLGNPQNVHLTLTHTTSNEEFAGSFDFSAAASFGFGAYSGDLSVKYSHSEKLNQYSEYLLVSTDVENVRKILKTTVLTNFAKTAAKAGPIAFFQACGDQFIEGYVAGGAFSAVVNARSSSKEEQTETSATMHAAAVGSGSMEASVKQRLRSLQNDGKLSIDITRKGPSDPIPNLTVPELIDYAVKYPTLVTNASGNAWTIRYLTSDYSGLVHFPAYTPIQKRIMNKLAIYVRNLYYRRAGLTYIKNYPTQFAPFEATRLNSELQTLADKIADVTSSAEDCATDSKKCEDPGQTNVPSLPDLKSLPTVVDPSKDAWTYVGSSVGADVKVIVVEGSWNNHCENNVGISKTIYPGSNDEIRFVNRQTGLETFASAGKPGLVPANSDVFYRVFDSVYFDNCPHDGLKVYLNSPVYREDYKPVKEVNQH